MKSSPRGGMSCWRRSRHPIRDCKGLDWDYKETKPQLRVLIDYDRAADLGVTIGEIGRTLETMLGSRRVTTYIEQGEEYDVILEGESSAQRTPADPVQPLCPLSTQR